MLQTFWFDNKESKEECKGPKSFTIFNCIAICGLWARSHVRGGIRAEAEAVLISFANLLLQLTPHTRHQRVFASIPSGTWLRVESKSTSKRVLIHSCGPMRGSCFEWSHNPIFRNDHDNPARSSPSFSPGSMQTRSQLNWNEYLAEALWRWDVSAGELRFN